MSFNHFIPRRIAAVLMAGLLSASLWAQNPAPKSSSVTLSGTVVDASTGEPLIGASIIDPKSNLGCITDVDGKFSLSLKAGAQIVEVSYLGYEMQAIDIVGKKTITVKLSEDKNSLDDVVVTGMYTRRRDSFTGSEVSVKAEEIKDLGSTNILQTLYVFNPSLRMDEGLEFGSDPNRVPEFTLRGQSTFDLRGTAEGSNSNPNAPLFILDGAQVSAETVYDYDINRIDQIVILKDASATAIYGSRGANGVIVITTKRPVPGRIKVDFSSNTTVSVPDLRDYNLMNAEEKLEFERLSGQYIYSTGGLEGQLALDKLYNSRLQEVKRGVNTYWLSQPLRTSVNQKYSATLEGGDNNLRYQMNLRYDDNAGVMKGSGRDNMGVGTVLDYNVGTTFRVRNELSVSELKANDSPFGSFYTYTQQNPYDRIYNEDGSLVDILSTNDINPMINATLSNRDLTKTTTWTDNFSLEWRFWDAFRFTARLTYSKADTQTENFISPDSPLFQNETEMAKKGSATYFNSSETLLDGNALLSYYNTFNGDHTLNVTAGTNFTDEQSRGQGFTATGFLTDKLLSIYYAQQFAENSTPDSSSEISRLVGFLVNANYGYKEKYYVDFSYRADGSSKFGSKSRFAPFWSFGLAWNLHNEDFWNDDLGTLRIRGSVGSTGSINFASSQAITRYYYSPSDVYLDAYGATLQNFGNNRLKWQQTNSINAGLDYSVLKGRLSFNLDVYRKLTDNLLLPMNVAPSTGFTSYTENVGKVQNLGMEARIYANWIKKNNFSWSTTFTAFHNKNEIMEISNELAEMNERNNRSADSNIGGTVVNQYENGHSTTALYVVKSAGIDPATGNEVYVKRDGSLSFIYDYKDKIVIGDTEPTFNGNIINNFAYKGFNLYAVATYRVGGQAYNSTLATKVEGANPVYNADKRVLYDRWKEPGDHALYRRIDDQSSVYQTSRFIQDNNSLVLSNVSLTYTVPQHYTLNWGIEYLKLVLSATDLCRLSSIRQERGITYPFARTVSFGLNVRF